MSLFSALQLSSNALQANQIALQVVSQNISNANTPGYSRAEVEMQAAPTQKFGGVLLGLGVQVGGVTQQIDKYLEERLRNATSDRASSDTKESTFQELEGVLNVLSDTSVNSSFNKFFAAVNEVLNQPESVSNRNLAVLQGRTLSVEIRNLASRVKELRAGINDQVKGALNDVNRLVEQVRKLNVRITALEGGASSKSDAVGLRDQRNLALSQLSELIGINVTEVDSNANINIGGEFLVFEGTSRTLTSSTTVDNGEQITDVQFVDTKSSITRSGGKLAGLVAARDDVLGAFEDKLDQFANTFAFEFNKVYSTGQGLKGYTSVTAHNGIVDVGAPLESAGLPNTPVSGSFNVLVKNTQTGLTQTHSINIDLNGLNNDDTSLTSLQQQLDAIDGIDASISSTGDLQIKSSSPSIEFAFAGDTSGTLAALGINTFFTGSKASDLNVDTALLADPRLFAASSGGIGADAKNAAQLTAFLDRPLDSLNGDTLLNLRDRMVSEVTEGSSATSAAADGYRSYEASLRGKQLAVSGVNIDEEAVKLMTYQRAFQASARFITTINELLDTLVKL
jgi:flagellar hook-associated protein 1 FlgK